MIYLSLILIALAAMCNAVMDTSVHHYHSSILKNLNPYFWDGEISWRNKYNNGDPNQGRVKWFLGLAKPVQITDAFHFFKMLMIIFITLSILTFNKCEVLVGCEYHWYSFLGLLGIYGVLWNTTFSLFYNKILR